MLIGIEYLDDSSAADLVVSLCSAAVAVARWDAATAVWTTGAEMGAGSVFGRCSCREDETTSFAWLGSEMEPCAGTLMMTASSSLVSLEPDAV